MSTTCPTDAELHAYVDGQLDPQRAAVVEAFLASSPEVATRVASWRRDAHDLQAAFAALERWPANPLLDPVAVRRAVRARTARRWASAASLLVALAVGGAAGWSARSVTFAKAAQPMQDAVYAYQVFATDRLRPVELRAHDAADLQAWLSARLGRPLALADLRPYGFELLGGRMLSTDEGPAAMILYESAASERISFYVRPSTHFAPGVRGRRVEDGLLASYWFKDGYGFALVGRSRSPRTEEVEAALPAVL